MLFSQIFSVRRSILILVILKFAPARPIWGEKLWKQAKEFIYNDHSSPENLEGLRKPWSQEDLRDLEKFWVLEDWKRTLTDEIKSLKDKEGNNYPAQSKEIIRIIIMRKMFLMGMYYLKEGAYDGVQSLYVTIKTNRLWSNTVGTLLNNAVPPKASEELSKQLEHHIVYSIQADLVFREFTKSYQKSIKVVRDVMKEQVTSVEKELKQNTQTSGTKDTNHPQIDFNSETLKQSMVPMKLPDDQFVHQWNHIWDSIWKKAMELRTSTEESTNKDIENLMTSTTDLQSKIIESLPEEMKTSVECVVKALVNNSDVDTGIKVYKEMFDKQDIVEQSKNLGRLHNVIVGAYIKVFSKHDVKWFKEINPDALQKVLSEAKDKAREVHKSMLPT